MCEKNLERKQTSLFPNDDIDDDINKEMIIDDENIGDCVNDDDDAIVIKTSKRKKRSKKKKKICKTCSQDTISLKKRGVMRYNNTYDQELAKEYCKDHEMSYGGHKCKPSWCGDCGYLINYEVEIEFSREDYYN